MKRQPSITVHVNPPITPTSPLLRAARLLLEREARQLFPNDYYAQQCHVSGFSPLPEEFEIVDDDAANVHPPWQ